VIFHSRIRIVFNFLKTGYQKLKTALAKTGSFFGSRLRTLFSAPIDATTFENLEQLLFEADLGVTCAVKFTERVRTFLRANPDAPAEEIIGEMRAYALEMLQTPPATANKLPAPGEPEVILVVGVNGSGKTTSIAKLAHHYKSQGKSVLLAAGDTFRAAAVEQLTLWAERLEIEIVKAKAGSDPSAVAFDALTAAKARGIDVVLIDTAGRLQNKTDLMHELQKIGRVMAKVIPTAPHQTLLILDATTGQNALDQAQVFNSFTPLTGILLSKLDGSAKGGIVLAIYDKMRIPIRWVGTGETAPDLMPFEAEPFLDGLFDKG
jgi:fused signal recognition particle receptor